MRKYATTILIMASMLLAELHTFWPSGGEPENWIWRNYIPMSVRWNVKYLSNEMWPILIFVSLLLYKKNKINYTTILAGLVWCILDVMMYLYNYKTTGYWKVYFWIVPIWIIMYLWKGRKQEALYKKISL